MDVVNISRFIFIAAAVLAVIVSDLSHAGVLGKQEWRGKPPVCMRDFWITCSTVRVYQTNQILSAVINL